MSVTIDKILAAAPTTTRGQPTQLSCDAKGERIAYASGKSIFVRSIDSPEVCKQYVGHTASTTVARFSPSGFYVASGDVSGQVRVWDAVEAVNTKGEYHIISGRINDIAWDGDSQRIIAVGDGRERFGHCITADSGNSVGEVSGHSKRVHLYDGKTGEHKGEVGSGTDHTGSVFAVAWAPDSKRFVTASADQTVRIWDAEAGKVTHTWRLGPSDGSSSVADQQVGVAWPAGRTDGLIISLSLSGDLNYLSESSDRPIRVVQGHNKSITAMGYESDKNLWTGSFDGRVCRWDMAAGKSEVVDKSSHTNQVTGFAESSDKVYSVGWDDQLRTDDGSGALPAALGAQPRGVAASGNLLVVALADGVAVYKPTGDLVSKLETKFTPTTIAAHKSSLVAVGGADNNAVVVYKLGGDGKLVEAERLTKSTAPVTALAFSPDGKALATGNASGKIIAYSTAAGWEVLTDRWSAHTARVTTIAWNAAGTHAVSGALDTNVHLWSLAKPGARVKAPNAHKDGVNGVAWVQNDQKVASAGADGAVKIWDVSGLQ
ncbi:WD repeat-containing protein 2 [Magnaporthiopsis poae ATCC 64411]|uniref:WD repeat-containing protein 2 n=1 Tax=Magnaporthiopsis poae (strain ATCC 64411 / 73-15) TaxID=644358 RepID=A0A0C4EEM7_MAGP6|nr:WD repeat-containing protein 2 [Magnaporthiopsis poae ATCC 64411]